MPKIEWTPPKVRRLPEIEKPIADFDPVPQDERCETCVGMGELYKQDTLTGSTTGIECWVCKGTGRPLPAPEAAADPFDLPTWVDHGRLP